ncbi:hypothetical protein G7Z17_g8020 [Cylindrodendrum hubeiense]|uniref:Uncharacterized protein n=1 Tax=Cylindrodendrum hubeiense TaxID=595255 RepID=A0A9P5HAD8_9HYPO|nr:hypothetical protein G7Z17_g8020 [Cylindrodendrum hubeiense]
MPRINPVALEPRMSDLVVESKIDATWDPATEQTTHVRTAVGVSARLRRLKTEETWQRKRVLGHGAYGTVWLEQRIAKSGSQHGESNLRAIKEIRKRPEASAYFFHRELEAIAKFSHERFKHCFVYSLGWFENDNSLFIIMEYIKHGDLQQYLTKPFPEPEVQQIALQVAEALQLMHESGFAHRDLKPGNILVSQKGPAWWVKIADFGISKRTGASTILRTMEIGTRGFMAPEILGLYCPDDFDDEEDDSDDNAHDDSLAYTPAVDLWALGEIAHRMLTGKPVFVAQKRIWSYVTKGTPFPTNELQSVGTSPQGIKFIQQVMAASPKSRLTATDAIKHEWLESHEFIDETKSRSSTDSARELPPSTVAELNYEPSAKWTVTARESETTANYSTEYDTVLSGVASPRNEAEAMAKWSEESLIIPAYEPPPEEEFEAPVPSESQSEATANDISEIIGGIAETTISASHDEPETSSTPQRTFSWENSAGAWKGDVADVTASPQREEKIDTPSVFETSEVTTQISNTTSPPSKRDLKSWWKSFKISSKNKEAPVEPPPKGIFGVPLRQTTDTEGIFRLSGSEKRVEELKTAFDSPERYGKGLAWDGYTVHDAANVLRRYLIELPEPMIPLDLYENFREPLRGALKQPVGDAVSLQLVDSFNEASTIVEYQKLITQLPPLNRQLLLYILDLLAVFASKSDWNRMNAQNLAVIFQPAMISHPAHSMAPPEYLLNQSVIVFLIENQDNFLIGMQ